MKTSAIIRILIWSVVALVLCSALVAGLNGGFAFPNWGWNMNGNWRNWFGHDNNDERFTTGNGSVSGIKNIDIEWVDGQVNVLVGDQQDVTFSETSRRELNQDQQMQYYAQDGTLHIQYCKSTKLFGDGYDKELTVVVPRTLVMEKLNVDVTSAQILLTDIQADKLDIESVSGGMRLSSNTANTVKVESVSGEIVLENVKAGSANIDNVSGAVGVDACTLEKVNCSSVSGEMRLDPGDAVKDIDTDSVSGRTRILISEAQGFKATYSTVSGGFDCDFPTEMRGKTATYNGGGVSIKMSSISGGIEIAKKTSTPS